MSDSLQQRTLRAFLVPAVRFCLRRGMYWQEFAELAKSVFVQVCTDDLDQNKSKITQSRISIMSGLNRKDVKRLYSGDASPKLMHDVPMRVLSIWQGNEQFCAKNGRPRSLTYKGHDSEFRALVDLVSKDVNHATVLFQLERRGAVEKSRGKVRVVQTKLDYHGIADKGIEVLTNDLNSMSQAVEENLNPTQETRNLYIRTEYDNILINEIPQLRKWMVEQGRQFHKKVRNHISQYDKDLHPDNDGAGGGRVVLTAYSWTCPETSDEPESN